MAEQPETPFAKWAKFLAPMLLAILAGYGTVQFRAGEVLEQAAQNKRDIEECKVQIAKVEAAVKENKESTMSKGEMIFRFETLTLTVNEIKARIDRR